MPRSATPRSIILATASVLALLSAMPLAAAAADMVPAGIAAAVSDAGRPEADKIRDENRKPGESVAFTGMKAGDKVADLLPGGGYFTRIFAKTVGPTGKVYGVLPEDIVKKRPNATDGLNAMGADKNYGNISPLVVQLANFTAPEPLDMVWTSQNYHDLKTPFLGPVDTAAMNKGIFNALKPGGVYIVLDHVAAAGSGTRDVETLHRIDPATVKAEVVAAGFVFEGQSDVLRHPEDDHTIKVVEGSIRGKTDQFIYKFRKPMAK